MKCLPALLIADLRCTLCAVLLCAELLCAVQVAKERLGPLDKLHSRVAEAVRGLRSAPSIKDLLKFEVGGCMDVFNFSVSLLNVIL